MGSIGGGEWRWEWSRLVTLGVGRWRWGTRDAVLEGVFWGAIGRFALDWGGKGCVFGVEWALFDPKTG